MNLIQIILDTFRKYLQQFPHFRPDAFDRALPYLSRRQVDVQAYFLEAGKICRHIAFVEAGLLRLFYLHDGKEVTHCFCKENTISTSYRSLVTQQPSDLFMQAIEPTHLIVVSYDHLQILYRQDPFWQQLGRIASENEYVHTEGHTRFLRDFSATERYLHIIEHEPELLQRVSLVDLASYLQIAPETLSRIRKKISRT